MLDFTPIDKRHAIGIELQCACDADAISRLHIWLEILHDIEHRCRAIGKSDEIELAALRILNCQDVAKHADIHILVTGIDLCQWNAFSGR